MLSDKTDYPLLELLRQEVIFWSIKTSIGFGSLLLDGIGDTIRVSLSDDPIEEIQLEMKFWKL